MAFEKCSLIPKKSTIILQAGIALGLLLLIILVILSALTVFIVFIRSDNQIISLIEKGTNPSLKQKVNIILKIFLLFDICLTSTRYNLLVFKRYHNPINSVFNDK